MHIHKDLSSSGSQQNNVNTCIVLLGTHRSARCMRLKSWHLLRRKFSQLPIYHLYVLFVSQNFIPSMILPSNIMIFCNFIYNANGIFKSWKFYCSRPSAGNKQSIHIASFPVRHNGTYTLTSFCRAYTTL